VSFNTDATLSTSEFLCCCKMSVRPSVCPSVTCRYSVEMAKHILKLFSLSGSHTILVLPYQTIRQYFNGDLF